MSEGSSGQFEKPTLVQQEADKRVIYGFLGTLEDKNIKESGHKSGIREWKEQGFNINTVIGEQEGSLIEVGGPTQEGYDLVDINSLNKKLFVSNLTSDVQKWDDREKSAQHLGKIDFKADATSLPLKNGSLAGILGSNISEERSNEIFIEAKRVLKDNGILVWQGGVIKDLFSIKNLGFDLKQIKIQIYYRSEWGFEPSQNSDERRVEEGDRGLVFSAVLQKKAESQYNEQEDIEKWKSIAQESVETKQEVNIPNFSNVDGHPLTPEEKIGHIRWAYRFRIKIPDVDVADGHKLNNEEQLDFLMKRYPPSKS